MYYTYMLRCLDNSIYTGMTNNLEKRMNEHLLKSKNGAKYTKSAMRHFPESYPKKHQCPEDTEQ